MALVSNVLSYRSIQRDNVAWRLLHSQHAPYIIAILAEHLGGEVSRRTVAEMENLVESDIEELRERVADMPLQRSSREYLESWRRDGFLVRKPSPEVRLETYELSGGALAAIGFAKGLVQPRRTATKSRLNIILDQLSDLSAEVSSNDERLRASLLAERERIDARLADIDSGLYQPIDDAEALERTREILALTYEMPQDFAYVSAEFEHISKDIYTKLISFDDEYADLLGDVFAGVDHIAQSPAGQSFRGFFNLLRDYEESERFYDNIDAILSSDFARQLKPEHRRALRQLMPMLLLQASEVNNTMTGLARSLRRFVQNQSFLEDRALRRTLDRCLAMASELTDFYSMTTQLPLEMENTRVLISPISRWRLYDPADDTPPPAMAMNATPQVAPMSLEELRELAREVEIDFDELIRNVNEVLAEAILAGANCVSVGLVLDARPATQGVASVVGLMVLADEQGRIPGGYESVEWVSLNGVAHVAVVERREFMQEIS